MADLTFLSEATTLAAVDRHIEARRVKPRRYLGMSELGDECSRRLWLKFHKAPPEKFSARILRLFDMGNLIEKRVIRDLKKAGFQVTGTQAKFKDGKLQGHCDGIVEGLPESKKPHILEIKSANGKSFKEFEKKGVVGHSLGSKYGSQLQLYMHYAKLDRALFIVECKETSARYQERIRYDKTEALKLVEKANAIIEAKTPPRGISDRPDWFLCRNCYLNTNEWCRREWRIEGGTPF